MSFFVGAVLGGPEVRSSSLVAAIQAVSRLCDRLRNQAAGEAAIDLVFHVPGSLIKPAYQGVRTGKFSKRDRILMVQVSVPESQVAGPDPIVFVVRSMRQAIGLAKPAFAKARIPFSVEEHLGLVARVEGEPLV